MDAFFRWLALVEVAAVDGDALHVQLTPAPSGDEWPRYVRRRAFTLRYVHRLAAALGCATVWVWTGPLEDADGTLYLTAEGRVIYRRSVTAERAAT